MARHILLIDPLKKLNTKKDTTCLLAHSLKNKGHQVYLIFEENMIFDNTSLKLQVYEFNSILNHKTFYLDQFEQANSLDLELNKGDYFHMRLDPPFDERYLRQLWLQEPLLDRGVRVVNNPRGVAAMNEKIFAYKYAKWSHPTFVGQDISKAVAFIDSLATKDLIIKPLDLFQGMGVERYRADENLKTYLQRKKEEFAGPFIIQPFIEAIFEGEVRSIYFKGRELGSILKVPKKGDFLANIVQGASFDVHELTTNERTICDKVAQDLAEYGIDWIAYDLLGGKLSEVNITCPGLLVELSHAYSKNLADDLIDLI